MNRFRKALSVILCTALLLSFLPAQADTSWNMYWKSGDHTVEFTAEDEAQIAQLMEEAVRNSEGTLVRIDADQESVEAQYERYISLFPDGSPVEYNEIEYEDIGHYRWAVGLPDDQSISRDEAWKIALQFLIEQNLATAETLVHYYPQVTFDNGYDPENPVWKVTPVCYDYEESDFPITAWAVAIYAHDGSICGYREVNGAG